MFKMMGKKKVTVLHQKVWLFTTLVFVLLSVGEPQAMEVTGKIQNIPVNKSSSLKIAVNVIVNTAVNLKLCLSSKHRY